jgi:hypothetical protein
LIQRRAISTNPPRAVYRDTETGRTWFDHDLFNEAGIRAAETARPFERALAAEIQGFIDDLRITPTAVSRVRQYIDTNRLLLTGENPQDLENILARYHDHVMRCLEDGEYEWE